MLNLPVYVSRGDFLAHQGPSFIQEVIPWINKVIFPGYKPRNNVPKYHCDTGQDYNV